MAQKTGYSKAQIGLHWAIAALIGVNYIVSDDMGHSFDATLEGKTPEGLTSTVHIYVGLLVLALVVLRMVVRRLQGAPDAIPSDKPLMDMAAGRVQSEPINNLTEKYRKSVAQIILRWNIDRGCLPLPKTKNVQRLQENFEVFDFELTGEEVDAISSLNFDYQYIVESKTCPEI